MALKAIVEALDDVPEADRTHYKEQDGKFVLGIEGIDDHPSIRNLKSAHERQKAETKKAKDDAAELKKTVDAFGDSTPDEIEDLRKRAEASGKPTDQELDELVEKRWGLARAKLEQQFEASQGELATLRDAHKKLDDTLARERIDTKIHSAAVAAKVRGNALDIVRQMGAQVWKLDENGEPIAMNDDQPINGAHGPMTIPEWIDSIRSEHDYLFEPNRGGGAGGSGDGDTAGVKTVDLGSGENVIGKNLDAFAKGEMRGTP